MQPAGVGLDDGWRRALALVDIQMQADEVKRIGSKLRSNGLPQRRAIDALLIGCPQVGGASGSRIVGAGVAVGVDAARNDLHTARGCTALDSAIGMCQQRGEV